jgi:hypothetical protein
VATQLQLNISYHIKAIYDFPISYEVSKKWGFLFCGVLEVGFEVQQNTYIYACTQMMDSERFCCQFLSVFKRTQERGPAVLRQSDGYPIGVGGAVSTIPVTRHSNYRIGITCQLQIE